jgi:hypothetical protein
MTSRYHSFEKIMKHLLFCILVTTASVGLLRADPPQSSNDAAPPSKLSPLMHMKLERSKAILEGLTLEDFDKVISNARSLRLLSLESGWNVIQTPEYQSQSLDFRRATDLIVQAAEEKDIHRATLGYVGLTVRCVECHSYMRKHRIELMKLEK